jgi:predicted Zn-dependent protease with MMP-like domain
MPFRVAREEFEEAVEKALATLPEEYRRFLTNITLTIEDYPGKEEAGRFTANKELLLGLFRGVPYPGKGGFFDIPHPMPDAIILFQKNIETICSSKRELEEQIRATLIHEVGHYFGLSEGELRRYE